MKKQKRFGIDIDGTVTCQEALLPFINEAFKLQLTLDDITEYELTPFVDVPALEFQQWFKEQEPRIYTESPMAAYAGQVLNEWKESYELYFISARSENLLPVTKQWFDKHDLLYHHIELIGSHDKIASAKKHRVDLFFEDKHDNAVAIAEECRIPVLLFDAPYNRMAVPENVVRVNDWIEAKAWVDRWRQETAE